MCRILAAARGEAISRRFGHGLRTWSIEASGRTKRMFSPSRVARLSWTPKKHPSGEIDYTGRISEVDDGLLRTALYDAVHIILTTQGLFTTEELGDADRQARRHEQGQGGARQPTGGDHASHACRRSPLQRCSSLTGGAQQFGSGHDTRPSRSEVPSPYVRPYASR